MGALWELSVQKQSWKHHCQAPQQEARFCFGTQRKTVQIIGNFKKSHHISTLSQVRGLQRVSKEAHHFHLGLFRSLKKNKQKINKNRNQNVAVEEIAFAIKKLIINPRKTRGDCLIPERKEAAMVAKQHHFHAIFI